MLRTRAPRPPHYLTQGDGAGGEGPDAAKAEGRCVSCERGGAFARIEPSVSRIWARKGATSQPASQKVPRTPGQVPERQGRRLESPLLAMCIIITPRGRRTGGARGGGCVREKARDGRRRRKMWVWDLCFLSLSLSLLLCVAVSLVCVYGFCMYACMHAGQATHPPGGDQTRGRRLPADSESSEFPRIDQASSAKPAPVQPGPAQPQTIRHLALGVGSIVLLAVTVCDVYMSVCMYYVCTCWGGGGLRSLGGAWWC